jgi:peptide/nickel transport system substrate-binding protein
MRHLRWQALIALMGVILVGSILLRPTSGTPIFEVTQPAPGGTYTEALVGSPKWLNPLLIFANPVDADVSRLIFSGLTRFDSSGLPVPDLANWNISEDQTTYTFILKPNLTWQDGAPLTARDVAFTLKLMQDPLYPGPADVGRLWQAVTVNVVNTQTVTLTLPEPFAPFLDYTAVGILPEHLLSGTTAAQLPNLPFNLNPIGSGPFQVERWLETTSGVTALLLSRFGAYVGPVPKLDQVQFNFYPEADAAFDAYKNEEVLGLDRLAEAQLAEALTLPNLGLYTALEPEYSLIFLNLQDEALPFFKDKKVRQALLFGLNRQAFINDILQGQAVVASSPILPTSWAYNAGLPTAAYDPKAAASLLDAAGWVFPSDALPGTETYVRQKEGVPISFTLTLAEAEPYLAIAEAARITWAELGIRMQIQAVPLARLRPDYLEPRPRVFDALLVDFNLSGTPDPDPYPLWHETQVESGQNYSGLSDRAISQYLEQARITTDVVVRAQLYRSFQARFADQVPALLLYYPVYNYAVDTRVNDVRLGLLTDPSDRFTTLTDWYLLTTSRIVEVPDTTSAPP